MNIVKIFDGTPHAINIVEGAVFNDCKMKSNEQPIFPTAGKLFGSYDMGSCQCGDVDWSIEWSETVVTFNHSNWDVKGVSIPYVGKVLQILNSRFSNVPQNLVVEQ